MNAEYRGAMSSGAKEIEKLPTSECGRCGLVAAAPIVVIVDGATECANKAACGKRRRTAERIARAREGAK